MSISDSDPRTAPGTGPDPAAAASFLRHCAGLCARAHKKQERKREKQKLELDEAASCVAFQQTGDTLLAGAASAPRGATEITLVNVHTQEPMTIRLNPALTGRENAAMYYRKAKKGRRGLETVKEQLALTGQVVKRLQALETGIRACIESSPDPQALEEQAAAIRTAMEAEGLIAPQTPAASGRNRPVPVPYRHYTVDGWDIYAGKTEDQNDELSTRFAHPSDVWLHVAAHAGSHVIIRRPKNADMPPRPVVMTAARFAAWHSKAKHSSYAEVHVTEARFVHKRRHAPPGEVIAERCKAVRVSPLDPQEYYKSIGAPARE